MGQKKEAPPVRAGPRDSDEKPLCLGADFRGDRVVTRVQGRAERGQTGDRHDGDESGDQAVLDRGRARFVAEQLANEIHDFALLRLHGRRRILDPHFLSPGEDGPPQDGKPALPMTGLETPEKSPRGGGLTRQRRTSFAPRNYEIPLQSMPRRCAASRLLLEQLEGVDQCLDHAPRQGDADEAPGEDELEAVSGCAVAHESPPGS